MSLPVTGTFNLSIGDEVAVYVRSSDTSFKLQAYSSFTGIYMPNSASAFGANLKTSATQTSMAPVKDWDITTATGFSTNSATFDAAKGEVLAKHTGTYLMSQNIIFLSQTSQVRCEFGEEAKAGDCDSVAHSPPPSCNCTA